MTTTATTHPRSSFQPPADPRDLFHRSMRVATATIAAVHPDQLGAPTPCTDMDVRMLLGHLVGVVDRAAAIGRHEDALAVSGVVEIKEDTGATEWDRATAAAEEAWSDDDALERVVVLPWVTGPGREVLLGYVNELVVHTWDLAKATGQHPSWDDDVIAAAHHAITSSLPAQGRTAMFQAIMAKMDAASLPKGFGGAPFAEMVEVPNSASPIDRLVAYNGRTPA